METYSYNSFQDYLGAFVSSSPAINFTPDHISQAHQDMQRSLLQQSVFMMGNPGLQQVAPNHFGQVRGIRKEFKEYSKEEFREISKEPLVKEILKGAIKLTKEQIVDRIKEHLK